MKKSVLLFDVLVFAVFVIAGCAIALPEAVRADDITPPDVPATFRAPDGNAPYLVGHAVGTQNYVCLPSTSSPTGFAWTLFTPEATLFDDQGEQLTTHFFSPNPEEGDTVRPTWQHSRDTSAIRAKLFGAPFVDPAYVAPGAIAWLLLQRAGEETGPTGGDRLTRTTFIHRLNTAGGMAPSTGCSSYEDVGKQAYVPYSADYVFYARRGTPAS